MNVDEAMETAMAYLVAREQMQEPLFESEEVAVTLAREVERLRVWKTRWKGDGDNWRRACRRVELELEKTHTKVEQLRAELAAAKAASVCPVNLSWCYESNECDIVITGMSDEDSTKFGNWLRERMKERGEG